MIHVLNKAFDGLLTHERIREGSRVDTTLGMVKQCLPSEKWHRKAEKTELKWFSDRKHSISNLNGVFVMQYDSFTRVIVPEALRSRMLSL